MDVIEIRRALHKIPELSGKEYQTSAFIKKYLAHTKAEIYPVGNTTGVVAFFNFKKPKSICFRADMDALPMEEKTGAFYTSENVGCMHACGHDGHMAMVLSLADYIDKNISNFPQNIVLLFQPSEEERGGAKSVVDSGILERLSVSEMYGTHIWPKIDEGKICTKSGALLASSTETDVYIQGKSVHAANYLSGADALAAGTYFLQTAYTAETKLISKEPRLLKCGKFVSGKARNIISDRTELYITMRCFSDETYAQLKNVLEETKNKTEEQYGVKVEIELHPDYPTVQIDEELLKKLDRNTYTLLDKPFMQAEDFGVYTRIYPCVFFLLGAGWDRGLHTDTFNFNENILFVGVNNYVSILKSKL